MGTTITGGEIRYTLDGAEPSAESLGGYVLQFPLDKTATVRAAVFAGGRRVGEVMTAEFVRLTAPSIAPVFPGGRTPEPASSAPRSPRMASRRKMR